MHIHNPVIIIFVLLSEYALCSQFCVICLFPSWKTYRIKRDIVGGAPSISFSTSRHFWRANIFQLIFFSGCLFLSLKKSELHLLPSFSIRRQELAPLPLGITCKHQDVWHLDSIVSIVDKNRSHICKHSWIPRSVEDIHSKIALGGVEHQSRKTWNSKGGKHGASK